uniref:Maternal effect embryo arrest 22 n=1 Tax=Ananas comosus var. bracteatus TaxID=296719 RepID=A0A6V7PBI0_ANACO|nr:unnamed protein product [Ananas comosus var. bracteatus]
MAADVVLESVSANPCCAEVEKRYQKLKEKRNALSQAVKLLEYQIDKLQSENQNLKKACEEERTRADQAKEENEKESSIRNKMEKEIDELKAQIDELKAQNSSLVRREKTKCFRKRKAAEEKKKAAEAWRLLKMEKTKAEEERKLAEKEKKIANELRATLENVKSEANEVREQLLVDIRRLEESNEKIEKERAKSERSRVEEYRKLVEIERKKANKEKTRADDLCKKLEVEKKRNEDLQNKRKNDMSSGRKRMYSDMVTESADIKHLKEKLKRKKEQKKHLTEMANLEKARNHLIRQELHLVKQDFVQLLCRFNMLDNCLTGSIGGIDDMEKFEGSLLPPKLVDAQLMKTSRTSSFGCSGSTKEHNDPHFSRRSCTRPISGIRSELDPPVGGSLKIKSHCSYPTSFSDREFMGSQGKDASLATSSAEIEKNSNMRSSIGKFSSEVRRTTPNPIVVRSPQENVRINCLTSSIPDAREHKNKKRRIENTLESIVRAYSSDNIFHLKVRDRISELKDLLAKGDAESVKEPSDALLCFEEMIRGRDYMKLLDLDDEADEERYRRAMEVPLSPTLPEIELPEIERMDSNPTLDVIDLEINSNLLKVENCTSLICNTLSNATQLITKSNETLAPSVSRRVFDRVARNLEGEENFKASEYGQTSHLLVSDCGRKTEITKQMPLPNINSPGDQCRGNNGNKRTQEYFVMFSSMNESNIRRIARYWDTIHCQEYAAPQEVNVVAEAIHKIALDKELLSEEKASIAFSLLLRNLSGIVKSSSKCIVNGDFSLCIDSFANEVHKVINGGETLLLFLEDGLLGVLIDLLEDFVVHKKVFMFLEGESGPFSSAAATFEQFICGCAVLASICARTDQISLVLELSYKILRADRSYVSWTLLGLHVFASICGEKFLILDNYDFLITAIKLVVSRLEGRDKSLSASPLGFESTSATFMPCQKCPFFTGSDCVSNFMCLLLDKLQDCAAGSSPSSFYQVAECPMIGGDVNCGSEEKGMKFDCGEDCYLLKYGNLDASSTDSLSERNICYLMDIVSLVELVGFHMGWDWTYKEVVVRVLKILDSCRSEAPSAALFVLVGQLGRFGIDERGFEQSEVVELRDKLSLFTESPANEKKSFPIQISAISALLNLLPFTFKEIIGGDHKSPLDKSQYSLSLQIQNWFAKLSKEQKAVSQSLFT